MIIDFPNICGKHDNIPYIIRSLTFFPFEGTLRKFLMRTPREHI